MSEEDHLINGKSKKGGKTDAALSKFDALGQQFSCYIIGLLFLISKCLEFIGTFFLVLTIGLTTSGPDATAFAPIAIGSILMVMIFMGFVYFFKLMNRRSHFW